MQSTNAGRVPDGATLGLVVNLSAVCVAGGVVSPRLARVAAHLVGVPDRRQQRSGI